ncbi:cytochrome P450 family protein [Ceratobasidium sp. AG-Ba]|nr:cytochrome P450 family protein [Ceratobasidium sp. AG-Ba]
METALTCTIGVSVILLAYRIARIGKRENYLPHGPPTVPLLGNLNIFPTSKAHLKFTEWARIYGSIYSLKIGPSTAIVLTDVDAVKEILEKRSQLTADRPPFYVGDLVTEGMNIGLARYTETWRMQRRFMHELLSRNACASYISIQQAESQQLLFHFTNFVSSDLFQDFYQHISRYSFSVILSVLFGKRAPHHNSKALSDFCAMEKRWQAIMAPGAVPPVDLLPILKYVPKRFAQWKVEAEVVREMQQKLYGDLLNETQERVTHGNENGCFMGKVLSRRSTFDLSDRQIAYLGGAIIEGAAGTSAAWIKVLVMAMVTHPNAQRKAHEELDRIIGSARMPLLEDLSQLPYIQAIIREVHRWRPIAPAGVPHTSIEDIHYQDYTIPANTIIFTNIWGISHDPTRYDRPDDFWPDRWLLNEYGLKNGAKDPNMNPAWFGSGRRSCPGIHLAHNSIAINTMNLLWAFDLSPEIDESTGDPIEIDVFDFAEGLEASPKPFACRMTSRSRQHTDIVEHDFIASREAFDRYEHQVNT